MFPGFYMTEGPLHPNTIVSHHLASKLISCTLDRIGRVALVYVHGQGAPSAVVNRPRTICALPASCRGYTKGGELMVFPSK